jgi:hypothetical protein
MVIYVPVHVIFLWISVAESPPVLFGNESTALTT